MERRMILFLLILLINLLIVMIYLLWNMIVQGEKSKYLDEGICHVYLSSCWSFLFLLCLSFI